MACCGHHLTQEQKEHPELFITCHKCGGLMPEKNEDWNATMAKAFAYSDELQAKVSSALAMCSFLPMAHDTTYIRCGSPHWQPPLAAPSGSGPVAAHSLSAERRLCATGAVIGACAQGVKVMLLHLPFEATKINGRDFFSVQVAHLSCLISFD